MPYYTEKVATWFTDLFGVTGMDANARVHMEVYKRHNDLRWKTVEAFVAYDWKRLWLKTRGWPLYYGIMIVLIPIGLVEMAMEWMYERWCDDEWSRHERSFRFIAEIDPGHWSIARHTQLQEQVDPDGEFDDSGNIFHNFSGFYGGKMSSMLYAECPEKKRTTVGVFVKDYYAFISARSAVLRLVHALNMEQFNCCFSLPKYDWLWRPKTIDRLTVFIDILILAVGWCWLSWWLALIVLWSWWYLIIRVKSEYDDD